jgi:hypothetical protein
MNNDWRTELEQHPKVLEAWKLTGPKWRKLGVNKDFIQETSRLKYRLEKAFGTDPKSVRGFFRSYSLPTGSRIGKINKYIEDIANGDVRDVLQLYVRYVARFGVTMYLRKKRPHFRTKGQLPFGSRFHVSLSKGHLRPIGPFSGGPFVDYFEDETVQMPDAVSNFLKTASAKFVRIDDEDGSSVLTELEAFAYNWEGLTFILHKAEQPYIICLIGENADSKMWKSATRAVHALRRECYGEKAGKPADIRQLIKVSAQLRRAGSSKEKAINVGKTKNELSSQSSFTRMKGKLT